MKKLLLTLTACLSISTMSVSAAEAAYIANDTLPKLSGDKLDISMQRGMQVYVNNCLGCHELSFQRYNRTGKDIGISDEIMAENLIFSPDAKVGDLMTNNMRADLAANWFGATPPDLSVVARARGTQWLYNYLRGFYVDDSRPYGVNNSVFKDVGMPHVLEEMQGVQAKSEHVKGIENDIEYAKADLAKANKALEEGENAAENKRVVNEAEKVIHDSEAALVRLSEEGKYFTITKEGHMTPEEFDTAMADLTNFLEYVGEPIKRDRERLGVWVLLFITFFGVVAYFLKKEYWRDIH